MFRHPAEALDFMDHLVELQEDQAQWSQATFGADEVRGPLGALAHLEKEAREAGDEWKAGLPERSATPEFQEEMADCFLLLLDAMRRSGMRLPELLRAAETKMVINKNRTWPKPTSDAPVEHVVADLSEEVERARENMPMPNADYLLQSEEESNLPPSISRKPLDNSYTHYCLFCDSRVHKNNTVGICPGCYAQGKRLDSAPVSQSTLK